MKLIDETLLTINDLEMVLLLCRRDQHGPDEILAPIARIDVTNNPKKRITAVIPWFPYSRQDRKAKPREPISGRYVADMLQLAGADRVLTMDLHAGQIQGFFTIPVDHMTALPLFARHFRDLGLTGSNIVSVAPDEGLA